MEDTYKTISDSSTGFYSEKGSKFYSFAYPIKDESEVKDLLSELQKKFHDARHFVFAYIIGENKEIFRCNDDGEPANSSGMPVLGQIRSKELTNVVVFVVRYFGGTKLGIPGLIKAYKTAAAEALANTMIIEKTIGTTLKLNCSYEDLSFLQNKLQKFEVEILENNFQENISFLVKVRNSLKDQFIKEIAENYKIIIE